MRVPAHAAVSETVGALKGIKKIWAKGLVNGVLRQYQRQADELQKELLLHPFATYKHPLWLIEKIKQDWPQHWQNILAENNQHPPFVLRVNQQKLTRTEYLRKCPAAVILPETDCGIVLPDAMDVNLLPGFDKGEVSVQDGAAQLAVQLLDLAPQQTVLDACAAQAARPQPF